MRAAVIEFHRARLAENQLPALLWFIRENAMRQTRIRKSTRKPSAPREIDTRTPSGRPLPY